MGALHEGHLGLVRRARLENDVVVVSIFVNPLQFGERADLEAYPRQFEDDSDLLRDSGCDMVFTGSLLGKYGFFSEVSSQEEIAVEEPGPCALGLEGEFRKGHFDGVATIVRRLFEVTVSTTAYFGEKDYQQTLVVRDLAKRMGLSGPRIVVCPIGRERSGLARSSRNSRLSEAGRKSAAHLSRALAEGARCWREEGERSSQALERVLAAEAQQPGIRLEYAAVRDPREWTTSSPGLLGDQAIALVAAEIDGVRLIDNLRLDVVPPSTPFQVSPRPSEAAVVLAEAPAKINPWLEVTQRRSDGFHEVDLTMLCIDLVDHLRVSWVESESSTQPIELEVSGPAATEDIPHDAKNLVWQAAQLALDAYAGQLPGGHLRIELYKRIPSRAGLGGGSSDAAAALASSVRLLELVCGAKCGLASIEEQGRAIAAIGSDCAFFLAARSTGFGRCTGRGERVEPIAGGAHNGRSFELFVPEIECGTAAVYGALHLDGTSKAFDASDVQFSYNRLLEPALATFPALAQIRAALASDHKGQWCLSGSGSALFRDLRSPPWQDLNSMENLARETGEMRPRYVGNHRPLGFGVRLLGECSSRQSPTPHEVESSL